MHLLNPVFAVTLCALAASPVAAQFAKPEQAIKYRQSAMYLMQHNVSWVAGMAQGKLPFDARQAAESAATAEFVSKLPWVAFGEGTDKGAPTKAKSDIWKDKVRFQEYAEKMQSEMTKLAAAAKTGNQDALKPAVAAVGAACKTCHDTFRE